MKLIIAGSRSYKGTGEIIGIALREAGYEELVRVREIQILCGHHHEGIDPLVEPWAKAHGLTYTAYPALWDQHGRSAGPRRNLQMAEEGDALVAIWDGKSRGTLGMIQKATANCLATFIWPIHCKETGEWNHGVGGQKPFTKVHQHRIEPGTTVGCKLSGLSQGVLF